MFLLSCIPETNHEGKIDYIQFVETYYEPAKAIGKYLDAVCAILLLSLIWKRWITKLHAYRTCVNSPEVIIESEIEMHISLWLLFAHAPNLDLDFQ